MSDTEKRLETAKFGQNSQRLGEKSNAGSLECDANQSRPTVGRQK
jgi:hypothetical protein